MLGVVEDDHVLRGEHVHPDALDDHLAHGPLRTWAEFYCRPYGAAEGVAGTPSGVRRGLIVGSRWPGPGSPAAIGVA